MISVSSYDYSTTVFTPIKRMNGNNECTQLPEKRTKKDQYIATKTSLSICMNARENK